MCDLVLTLVLSATAGCAENGQPRRYHDLRKDLRVQMRREVRAETGAERAAAVKELCALYRELIADPRLAASPTLQEYRSRLWKRLTTIKRELERNIARRQGPSGASGTSRERKEIAESLAAPAVCPSDRPPEAPAAAPSLAGARGGGAVPDFGPALVALIERTISPEFWAVNGGPGTIVYYPPGRALVVRATTETHHDVRQVLQGLRDANK